MIFEYVLVLFVSVLNYISTGMASAMHEEQCQELNVVLFFAKFSCGLPKDPAGMKALDMHEVAKVKSSFPGSGNSENCNAISRPSCKKLLNESLTSLIHFSQNALGMKTAVVSVTDSENANGINNEEPETPPEIREGHFSQNIPRDIFESDTNKKYIRPSNQQQFLRKPEMTNSRNVITSPEHTEVFKIRAKRQIPAKESELPGEIVDVPLEKENKKYPWDVLDVMAHIRFSFFGKFFEDASKEKLGEEENQIADTLIEHNIDAGLFETVKTTLTALQEDQEEQLFMAVFGGHLSEISNCESPLIQTIKHVMENTDPNSTLLVLTGYCPEHTHEHVREDRHEHRYKYGHGHERGQKYEFRQGYEHKPGHKHVVDRKRKNKREQNVVSISESTSGGHHENATIPVFAKGPYYEKLSQCFLLFDVPVVVKTILEQIAPTFEGQPLIRSKRNTFGDIRMDKANYESVAYRGNRYHSLAFNLCIFILFII